MKNNETSEKTNKLIIISLIITIIMLVILTIILALRPFAAKEIPIEGDGRVSNINNNNTNTNSTTNNNEQTNTATNVETTKEYFITFKKNVSSKNAEGTEEGTIDLFLNNNKIKTVNYSLFKGDVTVNTTYDFCNNYILVEIDSNYPTYTKRNFFIFNKNGETLGNTVYDDGATKIKVKANNKVLTYELTKNSLTIPVAYPTTKLVKYTVENGKLNEQNIKTYSSSEVEITGK